MVKSSFTCFIVDMELPDLVGVFRAIIVMGYKIIACIRSLLRN